MTARDNYETACWVALARHGRELADGAPTRTADNTLVDGLLKAADAYVRSSISALTERAGTTPGERRQALFASRPDLGHARIDKATAGTS